MGGAFTLPTLLVHLQSLVTLTHGADFQFNYGLEREVLGESAWPWLTRKLSREQALISHFQPLTRAADESPISLSCFPLLFCIDPAGL